MSRCHSISVVQPQQPTIVGFNAPGHDTQDELAAGAHSHIFHAPSFGHGGFVLSDDNLATDLGSLSLSKDGSGPLSSAHPPNQPSSLPIYAPISRSPLSSDQISPYQCINLNILTGTSFASRQRFGSPSDSGLSAGDSPPRSQLEQQLIDAQYLAGGNNDHGSQQQQQQQQQQSSLTAHFIPGKGIQYLPQGNNDPPPYRLTLSHCCCHPPWVIQSNLNKVRFTPQQKQHCSSDAPVLNLNDLSKGVPLSSVPASWPLYIVEFKAGRTDLFYLTDLSLNIRVGDLVIMEADWGKDLGTIIND
ncbi:hypothetical protein PISMIDRAFT_12123 [Pisolithus microcarpus 441]|uniref:Uncharacterized protein n=1 Tax=Pisolithus microcarpus 441 TaxID=765257 RepID=A0A0C9Z6M0_9AGAM|nr:hypothetical protein BKA83DRAFT_12123 [Pisolithus microcarpus]KIK21734.1 hypothetical protein PISMIDRAFT_12123 [Pisolithus microcarpus 441]